jgi:hypothetical protein
MADERDGDMPGQLHAARKGVSPTCKGVSPDYLHEAVYFLRFRDAPAIAD